MVGPRVTWSDAGALLPPAPRSGECRPLRRRLLLPMCLRTALISSSEPLATKESDGSKQLRTFTRLGAHSSCTTRVHTVEPFGAHPESQDRCHKAGHFKHRAKATNCKPSATPLSKAATALQDIKHNRGSERHPEHRSQFLGLVRAFRNGPRFLNAICRFVRCRNGSLQQGFV